MSKPYLKEWKAAFYSCPAPGFSQPWVTECKWAVQTSTVVPPSLPLATSLTHTGPLSFTFSQTPWCWGGWKRSVMGHHLLPSMDVAIDCTFWTSEILWKQVMDFEGSILHRTRMPWVTCCSMEFDWLYQFGRDRLQNWMLKIHFVLF